MSVHDQAYVTLATNDQYALGAIVLAHSLKRTSTQRQIVCMVTKDVSPEVHDMLKSSFHRVVDVNVVDSNDAANLKLLGREDLGCTFTKLHCWRLTEYKKCVFLDSDMIVLSNVDELFDREELSACRDAGWPDYFNSGLFVYVPSAQTYAALVDFATEHGSFDGGDQGLLNRFFANWGFGHMLKHLPFAFNCTAVFLSAAYTYLPAVVENLTHIRVVHFAGPKNKPWHFLYDPVFDDIIIPGYSSTSQAPIATFVRFWWHIFITEVHGAMLHSIHRAQERGAQLDELLHRIAEMGIRDDSQLRLGERMHPYEVEKLRKAQEVKAQPAEQRPAEAEQAAPPPAPEGPKSFASIERKLKEQFK